MRKGQKHSEDSKAKMSVSRTGRPNPHSGYPVSAETKRKMSEAQARVRWSNSEAHMGRFRGRPAAGFSINKDGYCILTGQRDHPLAHKSGTLSEHRKVLYDGIGPGPHPCHWLAVYGCGQLALEWGGHRGIQADHLNCDKLDNRRENLVPSCISCNVKRRSKMQEASSQ